MNSSPELSVIIPTFDEAQNLPLLVADLHAQRDLHLEVIVSDGGSSDQTVEVARQLGTKVVTGERGRGAQMNRGSQIANGDYLLFLHADTRLRDIGMLRRAIDALERHESDVAGHFSLVFVGADRAQNVGYRYLERKSALNRPNTTNGDQGFLVHRRFLASVGPFDESLAFLEDQRLAERIRDVGRWVTLPGTVETSTRRFHVEGFGRRYLTMAIIMGAHDAGLDHFFKHVEMLYPEQSRAEQLDMARVFDVCRRTMAELDARSQYRAWLRIGRYARRNAWQLFFYFDVLFEDAFDGESPLLEIYDDRIEPMLDNAVIDALSATLTWQAIMVLFPAWFALRAGSESKHI